MAASPISHYLEDVAYLLQRLLIVLKLRDGGQDHLKLAVLPVLRTTQQHNEQIQLAERYVITASQPAAAVPFMVEPAISV